MSEHTRFSLGRRIGEGGMGVVYEAYDSERQEQVALKALPFVDGANVYRLKQEFRTLLDVAHPNLVSLYELLAEDGRWFFTMELIRGVTFLEHVRRPGRRGSPGFDERALRRALAQLADGMRALHLAGKIHRDVKPSNVLVSDEGRVVILDFGISVDRERSMHTPTDAWAQGTADYMSPEQVEGEGVSTACDWYSVGVMLFEALTGSLPFTGSPLNVMYRKQQEDAPAVRRKNPDVPADLATLCDRLLSRDPRDRPDGDEVLELLGERRLAAPTPGGAPDRVDFIGRESQLAELERALLLTRQGRPATVYLHGLSGIGKSTIVEHFLDDVAPRHDAVVLTGRCYDRESLPYNAFDGVIDSLAGYLERLGDDELLEILPPDIELLSHLFPVQLPIGSWDRAGAAAQRPRPDARELRRRAIEALRALLRSMADRQPLVVYVDDWHWSDADSVTLGLDLLRGESRPSLLLIVSFRTEEIRSKPFLKALLEDSGSPSRREIVVGPMSDGEAARLAELYLGGSPETKPLRDTIVREARGSPFFIEQLCRHAREVTGQRVTSLSDLLDARLDRLPEGSRALLETLAVAGRPIDFAVAQRAARLDRPTAEVRAVVAALRVAHLIRPSERTDWLEVYHDRIRETVAARVPPDEAALIHGRLAEALAATESQPETLFEHLREAGLSREAGRQAARAGRRALEALAYDRAITLYRQAIEIGTEDVDELVDWRTGLAEALAASGHPGDAAEVYMKAAETATSDERSLDLRRAAAEQFLVGGHNKVGLEVTRALLQEVGLRIPRSPRLVIPALLLRRAQIWLRGLDYELRDSADVDPEDRQRMDICLALTLGLMMTDYILAAYFQALYLLLALRVGDGRRLARALTFEAGFVASLGARTRRKSMQMLEEARALAQTHGTPTERALLLVGAGSAGVMQGRYREAADYLEEAERVLREECSGAHWELTTCQIYHITALTYLGRTAEMSRMVPELLESAGRRGSLFERVELRTRPNIYWLFRDEPAEARRHLAEAMSVWERDRFYRQDYNWLRAEVKIDLYLGEPSVGWARLERHQRTLRRSQILRVQLFRVEHLHLWGRVALATAARGQSTKARLGLARRCAAKLDRERVGWARGLAALLRAGAAAVQGDEDRARERLSEAVAVLEEADTLFYARPARRRLGALVGGDEGARLVREADEAMRAEAIASPARLTAMLVPGFDD